MKFPGIKIYCLRIVFLIFILFINFAVGQDIKFEHLSAEDGLSNSYVNCLLQDQVGFIWFGTDDGLNRYDGYEIKVYRNVPGDSASLPENIIWSMFESSDGYMWLGTKNGKLSRYDPYSDSFRNWFLDSSGAGENNITFITEDKNKLLWIGTYKNGLYRFDPSKSKFENWKRDSDSSNSLSNNFVTGIIEDEYSNVWVSTYNGLNKFNPWPSQNPFTYIQNNINDLPIWYVGKSSFFEKLLWIEKLDGLFKFDPITEKTSQIVLPESSLLPFANSVSSLVEESFLGEKILWVGTYGGLVRFNLTTGNGERFVQDENNSSGIQSNQINDLAIDRSGVIWIATDNGLYIYSPKRSKFNFPISERTFSPDVPELKNGNVRAILQTTDESIWFGAEQGLVAFIKGENKKVFALPSLQSLNTWCLSRGNSGNLWIGTYGQGLKELNLKSKTVKSWKVNNPEFNASPYYYIKSLLQDRDGMLWIGFWGGGLARLNPLNNKIDFWRHEPDNSESLSFNDVWAITQDRKGRIWIGTNGRGLNLFNPEKQNSFSHWRANNKDAQSLSNDNIFTISEATAGSIDDDQTILWIGTANGLNKFIIKNDAGPEVKIFYYTVEDGLPDNSIESILEDENGNLWIGTSSGISFFNLKNESFTNFGPDDGLSAGSNNSTAGLKTKDGLMIFGSTSGVNFFNPKRISQSRFSPPVLITEFQLFNHQDEDGDSLIKKSIVFTKDIILSYRQNDFSLQFTSLDYNAPEAIQYAYRLEGFEDDWTYCGSRRFVTYTNLDPGNYVFHVKATNSDGVWNEDDTKLTLVIKPPFWETWWAYSLYAIAFLSTLTSLRSFEIKRRKKKEENRLRREREEAQLREAELRAITVEQEKEIEKQKIRNRIAQDLHDEIGSNLSSISLMSELIQKDGKINSEVIEKIRRIQKVAKGSSQAMRDIVWLTNPSSDNIKDLISKMNEVANDLLGGLNWQFEFPKSISGINLVPEVKRNIFFIYKESLNNILKHSNAKNVSLSLEVMSNQLILAIKDDGGGFDASSVFNGNGLKNLNSRAKEINGDLSIVSSPKSGTTIGLLVNITRSRD